MVKKREKDKSKSVGERKMNKKEQQKVASGISNFDKISEGGFERDSTNLIVEEVEVGRVSLLFSS